MYFCCKNKGSAVTKQRNVTLDSGGYLYDLYRAWLSKRGKHGLTSPLGVHVHSTRAMTSSQALFMGSSMEDVCAAAGWSSTSTFVKFFSLDVRIAPGFQVLSA